ncbi:replicative DNA helicase [Kitasatospora sp. NPDC048239]|uniref:replicative DNA helicase n=1 Tax=Kitasatospora sp. NPDC048239 TaxID=3364046 RepID=UPI0037218BAD
MTDHDDDQALGPVPPQDLHAERAVLGAMHLASTAVADAVGTGLRGSEFYRPAHEKIYDAIVALYAAGDPADPITVSRQLAVTGDLDRCGGPGYLHTLVKAAPAAANAEYYAAIVREKARLRTLAVALNRGSLMIAQAEGDPAEVVEAIQAEIIAAAGNPDGPGASSVGLAVVRDTLGAALDAIEAVNEGSTPIGVPWGFRDLDALTGGMHPGQMIVIAGRPGMGKSTGGMDIARSAAIGHGLGTAFFSLEMSRVEIMKRLICAEGCVPLHHMQVKAGMTDDDWTRVAKVMPRISDAPLYLDDSPDLTMTSIRTKARQIAAETELRLIVIDYMQLLRSGGGHRYESRQQEVSDLSRSIKLLAKELEIPVIALSQLNRGPEQRTDKKPMAADLRESGAIEQDADLIILLHREDAYDKESARAGEADWIVAKNRSGPTSTITVAFQGHYARFVDMAADLRAA